MNLVLYTHPAFLGSQSHGHFARMLIDAYRARGHSVALRQPEAVVHRRVAASTTWRRFAKWAGYIDQYLIFPRRMRAEMRGDPADTLYVFCDQALGPWIPNAAHRPHVVHCHDLLALRSALGRVPENPTSRTGRIYQRYIRAGFRRARHFISISRKTRSDLHRYGGVEPVTSEVVYNGLNHPYRRQPTDRARATLLRDGLVPPDDGFLLHVGGGQWYKNSEGVLHLYTAHVQQRLAAGQRPLALWMVSPAPGEALRRLIDALPAQGSVRFFQCLGTESLEALYSLAAALIFPSLDEGFGWPIAEGLACGCPVLTTGEAPMNEVGGTHAHYLVRLNRSDDAAAWAARGAGLLGDLLARTDDERDAAARDGIAWARRFEAHRAIDRYLAIYETVLAAETAWLAAPRPSA